MNSKQRNTARKHKRNEERLKRIALEESRVQSKIKASKPPRAKVEKPKEDKTTRKTVTSLIPSEAEDGPGPETLGIDRFLPADLRKKITAPK